MNLIEPGIASSCARRRIVTAAAAAFLGVLSVFAQEPICDVTASVTGGGTVTSEVISGGGDPAFSVFIAPNDEYVIFENSVFRAEYRDFFADFAQYGLRNLYFKAAGGADLICGDCGPHHYLDADAGRGTLVDAILVRDDAQQKTVRFIWRGAWDSSRRITQEVSIFPNLPLIRIDYINVQFGINTVDLALPGGSFNNTFIAHGAADWVRGYVTHDYAPTEGSYYNRYPPDGVNDPANGGSLNYNGSFIVGVYHAASGIGYGRVMHVADNSIVKLLNTQSEKRGLEFFPYPFGLAHAPFTGYLFLVTGGGQEILTIGRQIADGDFDSTGAQCGDVIRLTATAYGGWEFAGWSGDVVSNDNPLDITLSGQQEQVASFLPQTATYFADFESEAVGADPVDWFDTDAGTLNENDSLFAVGLVDGTQTLSTSSTGTNIHSHYLGAGAAAWRDYSFAGRMRASVAGGGIGVTFLSAYPSADAYYRVRSLPGGEFHIDPHGTTITSGVANSGVIPTAGQWYRFRLDVFDTGTQTEIRARVWRDGEPEPAGWSIDCADNGPTRRTTGTIGAWSMGSGVKNWDELLVQGAADCGGVGDSDGDGVCDDQDVCPGGDDTIDDDGDGIPNACECPGDLDGDLDIDLADLSTLLANFDLNPAAEEDGDIDGDGVVGLSDLALLLSAFGGGCR